MTQAIQTYLEDFAKTSIEFQKKYDVSKIENCINFIMKQAKEFLKSKNGYIEDNIVFKWARDYFNDDIFAQEQAEQENLKYNISSDDFFKFRDYKQHSCYGLSKKLCNYNIYKYIKKITKNEEITDVVRFYDDYLYMLEHNHTKHEKSDYWLFPNTYEKLCKLHDKLMQEETAYNEFIRQEREKEEREKKKNRNKKYSKIVSKYNDFSSIVDGFSIFVPQNTSLWQKQAEVLNQCIISSNYIDKVVDKSSVLIFIQKNDVPIATVEIGKNNQILQFYCDEHDRQNCKPTEQLRNTFNLWLKDKIFFDKTEKKCA